MPFVQKHFFDVRPSGIPLGEGRLLVSAPFMTDAYFDRTVVLLVQKDEHGHMGFILNRPLQVHLHDVLSSVQPSGFMLHNGGPVGLNQLFFLHTYGQLAASSIHLGGGLYMGRSEEDMLPMLKAGLLEESRIRFLVGYAGWSAGQLEREMAEKAWVVASVPENVMDLPCHHLWRRVVGGMGEAYRSWLDVPDKASYN
ncbi:MAG: YqgE/AlgH family protein [Bacteroidales bacterium]|nr:YqgE/AlgH family protein [Bacteroidales bacterium]